MSIPLLLKIKPGALDPRFIKCSDTNIEFQSRQYKFNAIYDNDISSASLDRLMGLTCALVLMGPTGSGKTTTLREVLAHEMAKNRDTHFTACQVSENRSFVDMVDDGKVKRYLSSLPMDKQLKKIQLNANSVDKLFADRKTSATTSNAQSSRSCLIVTMYSDKQAVTLVDMMGNEKYDPASTQSNVFANSNVSSITQLLMTRTTRNRSSNLVTNLIFQKLSLSKLKFILHLDVCGNPELIKSSLYNIVDVVKDFRVEPARGSRKVAGSTSKYIPSYARPTASSLSPRKSVPSKSLRVTKPAQLNRIVPLAARPRLPRSLTETPSRKPINRMTQNLYELEVKSLKETNSDLTRTTMELTACNQQLKEAFAESVIELKDSVSTIKNGELQTMKEQIVALRLGFDGLVNENGELISREESTRTELVELKAAYNEAEAKFHDLEKIHLETNATLQAAKDLSEATRSELALKEEKLKQSEQDTQSLKDSHRTQLAKLTEELSLSNEKTQSTSAALDEAKNTILAHESKISAQAEEEQILRGEILALQQQLLTKEEDVKKLNSQIAEDQTRLEEATNKIHNLETSISDLKRNQSSNSSKFSTLQAELEKVKTEKKTLSTKHDELTKKHSDLVSYNKFIVEKYLTALDEKDTLKADESKAAEATISELEKLAQKHEKLVKSLEDQVEEGQREIAELTKYKSKCDNLETTARQLRNDMADIDDRHEQEMADYKKEVEEGHESELRELKQEMKMQHEEEIQHLKAEIEKLENLKAANEELKRQVLGFKTPSPQKLPFNPATDIFEASSHKDYLKAFKQSMKTNTPSPKNVLRDSNHLPSSDKKKLKRKASGYINGKSPKAVARMSS